MIDNGDEYSVDFWTELDMIEQYVTLSLINCAFLKNNRRRSVGPERPVGYSSRQ
jgi:hypothetical protein